MAGSMTWAWYRPIAWSRAASCRRSLSPNSTWRLLFPTSARSATWPKVMPSSPSTERSLTASSRTRARARSPRNRRPSTVGEGAS
ncbi:Uncharacterised protein [Bordetella pertussis]|nr:Uncharacterised protein [Bordetella pertussis]